MFEAFTDAARIVMALANREAQRHDHEQIYAAHILLGITKAGAGVGSRALDALGVTPANARREIEKLMNSGSGSLGEDLPPTSEAKKAIEKTIAESRDLGHDSVGTGHLLLGLLGDRDGVPAKVLQNLGLTISVVREKVVLLLRKTNGSDNYRIAIVDSASYERAGSWLTRIFEVARTVSSGCWHLPPGRFSGLFARRAMLGQSFYGWIMSDRSASVGRTPFQRGYLLSPEICFVHRP